MSLSSEGGAADHPQGSVEERILPRLGDHHKTVTMAEIAKAAGVSQGAISSLLNDRDYGIRVSEKTRDRVFKICRELGYIPNDLRAVVRMYPELGDLCLLASSDIPDVIGDPFCARVASAAMQAASETSRHLVLAPFSAQTDYAAQPDALPHPIRNGTASKFLCVGTPNTSLLETIVSRGFPVTCIGSEVATPGVTSITPDYAGASQMAVDYLFKLGHKHIAILSGSFGSVDYKIIELNRGVRLSCERRGVPIESQHILHGDLTFKNGFTTVEQLLSRKPRPTAIFCFSDAMAAGVLVALNGRGVKVPGDVSVIGCSDDSFSEFLQPALTTIHIPAEEMAVAAVQDVERRVREIDSSGSRKIVLPARLVERASCGAPGCK